MDNKTLVDEITNYAAEKIRSSKIFDSIATEPYSFIIIRYFEGKKLAWYKDNEAHVLDEIYENRRFALMQKDCDRMHKWWNPEYFFGVYFIFEEIENPFTRIYPRLPLIGKLVILSGDRDQQIYEIHKLYTNLEDNLQKVLNNFSNTGISTSIFVRYRSTYTKYLLKSS